MCCHVSATLKSHTTLFYTIIIKKTSWVDVPVLLSQIKRYVQHLRSTAIGDSGRNMDHARAPAGMAHKDELVNVTILPLRTVVTFVLVRQMKIDDVTINDVLVWISVWCSEPI